LRTEQIVMTNPFLDRLDDVERERRKGQL
jgi:hypothetical protein